jgi:hypothetical protein
LDLPIAPMPRRLEDLIVSGSSSNSAARSSSVTQNQGEISSSLRAATAAEVEDALRFVPPGPRENWLTIGMALHHHFGSGGRMLWDAWSQRSDKYNARDQSYTWKKFKSGGNGKGTVKLGSLFRLAADNGWRRSTTA